MTAFDQRVLVVDDDDSVRRSLARLLNSAGHQVETFAGGPQMLASLTQEQRGCMVLDYRMPELNGLQVQDELRKRRIRLPLIFLTAYIDVPTSVHAMKQGAFEFLLKPFPDDVFLSSVDAALAADADQADQNRRLLQAQSYYETLTPSEKEVMDLVVTGLLNKQVALRLGIAEKTIKIHRGRVMRKMHADSLAHLVRLAGLLGRDAENPSV